MADGNDKLIILRGKFQGSRVDFSNSDSEARISVCFNPTEYTVAKRTGYAEVTVPGLDSPIIQFSQGQARTLAVELLLDSCTYDDGKDVRTAYVQKLEALTVVDGDFHAPPPCKVVWGSLVFVGLLESLSTRYVRFLDDGTPVRVRATLSFKEYISVADQMAETPRNSPDRRRVHSFKRGESLWELAFEHYGDARHWRFIAEKNNLNNPREVRPGTALVLPPMERQAGIFADGH